MFGKTPLSREELKIAASGLDKISAASFASLTGILSCPAALEHFNLLISFSIILGSTLWNSKPVSTGSPSLGRIMNSDQTPSKYATAGRTSLAPKNSQHFSLAGADDKRAITWTLTVTVDEKILPFQAVHGGETKQLLYKVKFLAGFSLIVNQKHCSNTDEVMRHVKDYHSYIVKEIF